MEGAEEGGRGKKKDYIKETIQRTYIVYNAFRILYLAILTKYAHSCINKKTGKRHLLTFNVVVPAFVCLLLNKKYFRYCVKKINP